MKTKKGLDYGIPCVHSIEEIEKAPIAVIDLQIVKESMSSTGFAIMAKCGICGKTGKNKYEFQSTPRDTPVADMMNHIKDSFYKPIRILHSK